MSSGTQEDLYRYKGKVQVEEFGTYFPGFWTRSLIHCARHLSYYPILRLLSSACRKLALKYFIKGPIDYDFFDTHVRLRPHDNLAEKRGLLNPSALDREEFEFIREFLPRGGLFLDIGANVGFYTFFAAKTAGTTGRVVSLEPNPQVFERLYCNIILNEDKKNLAEIIPLQLAVSDKNRSLPFLLPESNLGEGKVVETAGGNKTVKKIYVRGAKLLDILDAYSINNIDIMKIDIEGHEMAALRPFFEEAAVSLHPDYIVLERGDDAHWKSLFALCESIGYVRYKTCRMNVILSKQRCSDL